MKKIILLTTLLLIAFTNQGAIARTATKSCRMVYAQLELVPFQDDSMSLPDDLMEDWDKPVCIQNIHSCYDSIDECQKSSDSAKRDLTSHIWNVSAIAKKTDGLNGIELVNATIGTHCETRKIQTNLFSKGKYKNFFKEANGCTSSNKENLKPVPGYGFYIIEIKTKNL